MDDFAARLRQAMENSGLRANQVADRTGLSKARISQYVNGRYTPKWDGICRLAEVLSVSPAWLMGEDGASDVQDLPSGRDLPAGRELPAGVRRLDLRSYPMLGAIACGAPIFAYEDGDTTYVTAADTNADFCLIAKGDSMVDARIFDGDEVFIQQTDYVDNGEIAAVAVDDEATLKRVFYYPGENKLVLVPENPAYHPMTFSGEDLNHVHILGRAVAVQSKLK
ncbi:MAG: helix-turn-helix domain-containing protein [Clostridia bacterium]|nr:helix-turn-helix domain-containing protein [Clostridia bacterium]